MVVYTILAAVIVIFWPGDAFAWGPGTHLEVATTLLRDTARFAPAVVALMKRYREEFMYGMVSADILVGKKYAGYLHHSHNWDVAWEILRKCRSDRERASAYGYLSHLASDIIAHNYYIPYMIIKSFDSRVVNHTYWELRFDIHVESSTWNEMERVIKGDFGGFDNLLEKTLRRPLFSFKMNKKIFSTILLLQRFKQLRKAVEMHSRFSQWPLTDSEVRHYRYLMLKTTRDFLVNLKGSRCLSGEAAGLGRLRYANSTRSSLKHLLSRGLVKDEEVGRFIEAVRGRLKGAMFEPGAHLPESYEVL